jgi:Asp/Glu/hydantoin racemase
VIIVYPVKAVRKIPVNLAKRLSVITAKRRYIAILYVLVTFLLLPLLGVVLFN